MPIHTTPDHQQHLLHTRCTDIVSVDEVCVYLKTTWLDPAVYGYNQLIDYTAADLSQIDYGGLMTIAAESAKVYSLDPDSRCAMLIASAEQKRMADFYINAKSLMTVPAREYKSFTCREEAIEWLTEKHST